MMRAIRSLARCRAASAAWAWPSSVSRASIMPGSWRVWVKCRLNSLWPWRSRIMGAVTVAVASGQPVRGSIRQGGERNAAKYLCPGAGVLMCHLKESDAMDTGGFPVDLVLFGMIAGFLVLRLRSILGRRTGFERPPVQPYQPPGTAAPGARLPVR